MFKKEHQQFVSFFIHGFIVFLLIFHSAPVFAEDFATSAPAPVSGPILPTNAIPTPAPVINQSALHSAPAFHQPANPQKSSKKVTPSKKQQVQKLKTPQNSSVASLKTVLTGTVKSLNTQGFYFLTESGVTYSVNATSKTEFRNDTKLAFHKLADVSIHSKLRIFGIINNANKTFSPDAMRLLSASAQSVAPISQKTASKTTEIKQTIPTKLPSKISTTKVNNPAKKSGPSLPTHPTPASVTGGFSHPPTVQSSKGGAPPPSKGGAARHLHQPVTPSS